MSPPSAISNTTPSPNCNVVEDCAGLIKILSDGSILRSPDPLIFPLPDVDRRNDSVQWKQVIFDSTHNLHLRLYKPRTVGAPQRSKLPVLFYFHGGGFCFGSCSWPHLHSCCARLASGLNAVVVAPDYRLAPEHRLPAAFEDGVSAVKWLRDASDEWLSGEGADLENVIVMGDSSGGLIAHHLAVRFGLADARAELAPVRISKYVLLGPFFGGVERTKSEADCPKDTFLNLALTDQFWRLSLPVGADRDHLLVNPLGPEGAASLEAVEFEPTLVVVGECDLLRDRGVEYCERLKELGKPVELDEFEGQEHGFFTNEPSSESAIKLMRLLNKFIYNN